ncbi:MAG: trans-2-enoyl-CoA reductase family protein [Gammaproteobacteria bacterium]|nr:trans-2-enoyl-CoA reductase family protein [Gammaproteobacteria bacterium]
MIIQPRIRGFICTTAHPDGCRANVNRQVAVVEGRGALSGSKNALVIGCSGGFGLASRIAAGFGCGAATIGVSFEREPSAKRTATAGGYNNRAFESAAAERGRYARTFDGDAFADELRARVVDAIVEDIGTIDLLVYSLAAPVRTHPRTGERFRSAIKPLGNPLAVKTLDINRGEVRDIVLEAASEAEAHATVGVMGGEDWEFWIDALLAAGALAPGFQTVAYSYLGSDLTARIYREGTLGRAKADVDRAASAITERLVDLGGRARVAVLKAIVSQASAAIPVVPLYMSILFRVMREQGSHESCIEHIDRLFRDGLYGEALPRDEWGRLRADARELAETVQTEVKRRWDVVDTANIGDLADFDVFQREFLEVFGFGLPGVDYERDADPMDGS